MLRIPPKIIKTIAVIFLFLKKNKGINIENIASIIKFGLIWADNPIKKPKIKKFIYLSLGLFKK